MNDTSQALQKIARGTGIVFAGTVISMFFRFLSRITTKSLLTIPPEPVRGAPMWFKSYVLYHQYQQKTFKHLLILWIWWRG